MEHYEVVGGSPGTKIDEGKIYLLGEEHIEGSAIRRINGLAISTLASPGSLVMIEGIESLVPLTGVDLEEYHKDFYIDPTNIAHIVGWDMKEYMERHSFFDEVAILVNAVTNRSLTEARELGYRLTSTQFEWERELTDLFDQGVQTTTTAGAATSTTLAKLHEIMHARIRDIARAIVDLEDEMELDNISSQLHEVELALSTETEGSDRHWNLVRRKTPLVVQLARTNTLRRVLVPQLQSKQISLYFQERTRAMITTLDTVKSMLGPDGKAFLVTGIRHLEEDADVTGTTSPRSLHLLRQYVGEHSGIVALKPKILDSPSK